MSGQAATSRWARLWAWLYGRRAAYPAAVPAREPPLQAATTAAPADDGPPTAQVHAQLQFGLHALALAPRLASEPEPAGSAELEREVAQALQAQDWASRHLPRRPQLLPQLIQTVNDDAGSARVMATIIGQDPVLTGNLLRIANSPAFKVNERPVESLQRAVTLVGTEGVRQIISAVLVQPVMKVDCAQFPQFSAIVWEHALLASRAAADHARAVSGGDAFAAQWLGLT
ncbi:MAG: hypothetical protein GAK31_01476 [Stenotrophomonas maltophilia]|uniref:HDOD domain-containing protein n=1 Tax=Stenotrophomonas maltophilia TaxID=40324 RepID=A0A7V8FHT4_STEMA|nr:MAG: hypothetical protein GAK31_01476 [Stenotrophomonas maltophilia]